MHLSLRRISPRAVTWILLALSYAVPAVSQAAPLERKSEGGGITITAIYVPSGQAMEFHLSMDTHAGDLMAYDMAAISALRVNGEPELTALTWTDETKGSHHRTGVIRFDRPNEGSSRATTLELVVRGVGGGPDRLFRWELAKA